MNGTRRDALGDLCCADDHTPVVKDPDQVVVLDASCLSILGVDPEDPVVVAVDQDPVILDLVQPAPLGITHSVKTETGVGRDQLQGVLFV